MNRQHTYSSTRKQKAIRRSIALSLLVVLALLTFNYGFTPSGTLRDMEDVLAIDHGETVRCFTYSSGTSYWYYGANEHNLYLCASRFSLLRGWHCERAAVSDCSSAESASIMDISFAPYYGRLNDSAIARAELVIKALDGSEKVYPVEPFTEIHGSRYFFVTDTAVSDSPALLRCYDSSGKLIYTAEAVEDSTYTYRCPTCN